MKHLTWRPCWAVPRCGGLPPAIPLPTMQLFCFSHEEDMSTTSPQCTFASSRPEAPACRCLVAEGVSRQRPPLFSSPGLITMHRSAGLLKLKLQDRHTWAAWPCSASQTCTLAEAAGAALNRCSRRCTLPPESASPRQQQPPTGYRATLQGILDGKGGWPSALRIPQLECKLEKL